MTMIVIELPEELEKHYFGLVAGKHKDLVTAKDIWAKVSSLVLADIEAYHEYRRCQDNYREKVHP